MLQRAGNALTHVGFAGFLVLVGILGWSPREAAVTTIFGMCVGLVVILAPSCRRLKTGGLG